MLKLNSSGLNCTSTDALHSGSRLSLASSTLSSSSTVSHNLVPEFKTNSETSESSTVESGGSWTCSLSTYGKPWEETCSFREGRGQPWLRGSVPGPGDRFVERRDDRWSWPMSLVRSPAEDPKLSPGSFKESCLWVWKLEEINWALLVWLLGFPPRFMSQAATLPSLETGLWIFPLVCCLDASLWVHSGLGATVMKIQRAVTFVRTSLLW